MKLPPGTSDEWNSSNGVFGVTLREEVPPLDCNLSGGVLELSWPEALLGWHAQSNSVDVTDSNCWFDIVGSASVSHLEIMVESAESKVFYRLRSR